MKYVSAANALAKVGLAAVHAVKVGDGCCPEDGTEAYADGEANAEAEVSASAGTRGVGDGG